MNKTEPTILFTVPAILTKDTKWVRNQKTKLKQGSIIILPQDAVLVCLPPEKDTL